MRRSVHEARAYRALVGRPERNHLEDLSIDRMIILIQKVGWGHGLD